MNSEITITYQISILKSCQESDIFECQFKEYSSYQQYLENDGYKKGEFVYNDQIVYWK